MHPQIKTLYDLQQQDRQLTGLERRLQLIPQRIQELNDDLAKLSAMLEAERRKCDETRAFQRTQEQQLAEEEEMLRNSKARLQQVKNARELNATQREVETTKRMASARSEEIQKLKQGVEEAEQRIAAMNDTFVALQAQAVSEKDRLESQQEKLTVRIAKLREGRGALTSVIEKPMLRTYDRIRGRVGGIAFVAAREGRCSACKMHIPHQIYVQLRKGEEIESCESCGRLLYWSGHFPKGEDKKNEPAPKASPPKRRPAVVQPDD